LKRALFFNSLTGAPLDGVYFCHAMNEGPCLAQGPFLMGIDLELPGRLFAISGSLRHPERTGVVHENFGRPGALLFGLLRRRIRAGRVGKICIKPKRSSLSRARTATLI
jgi:hypothetical protein